MTDQPQVAETELRTPPEDHSDDPPTEPPEAHPATVPSPPVPSDQPGAHPDVDGTPGTPGPRPDPVPAPTVEPASPQPGRWGRAEPDGTIYLVTADGERVVGSWQAGDPPTGWPTTPAGSTTCAPRSTCSTPG